MTLLKNYIALIDDDDDDALILEEAIKEFSNTCDFVKFKSEEELLQCIDSKGIPPILILIDLHLPGIDGTELLQRLNEEESLADVDKIIYSGSALSSQDKKKLEADVKVIIKPGNYENAVELAAQLINKYCKIDIH